MDVSNKMLALVLIVAVVMSFGSTFITLNRLDKIELLGPTGRAPTDTGTANLTIQTDISINFDVSNVNFGSGYIAGGAGTCVLDTNGTSNASPNNECAGNFILNANPFLINNTGNQNVQLELRSTHVAANFTGGTGAELQWWLDETEGDACTSETGTLWGAWANVNNTDHSVCAASNFLYDNGGPDSLSLHMRVLIPDDATNVGSQIVTTITGTAS